MEKLLVAFDYSDSAYNAIKLAIKLAKKFKSKIWLLNIVDPNPDFVGYKVGPKTVREQVATELHDQHKKLQEVANELKQDYSDIIALTLQGAIVETILSQSEKLDVDLILVGTQGKGKLRSVLVGSTSEDVVVHTKRPVLVCHNAK
ncbi:MAG: universal stress protein [Gammaproteobacteria bacterium]|nr:universal stress protein [Gammaproteobacteria bacterium]MDH5730754.1 universal stress protein [Gammaproteobacteria bacterium]